MPTPILPLLHWRQPRWPARAALSLALILGGSAYAMERERFGLDDQQSHCPLPYTVRLSDTHPRKVARANTGDTRDRCDARYGSDASGPAEKDHP